MKKQININEEQIKHLYKCEIYEPFPNIIIEEIYIKAFNQIEAKQKAKQLTNKTNILLLTAQKIHIYE